jgi:tetratricopeptide (TPR) repeat protein
MSTFTLCAVAALSAAPTAAGVISLGSSFARVCYEAAEFSTAPSRAAQEQCDKALSEGGLDRHDTVATYVNRGILKFRADDFEGAIADYDDAIRRDPEQPEAYLNKAAALLRMPNGHVAALPLFDTALRKRTQRPAIAYYGRAIAYEMTGNLRAAYRDYREAVRLDPRWDEPKSQLARFQIR